MLWLGEREEGGSLEPTPSGVLKFNVNKTTRSKPGLPGIGGVLCNDMGEILCIFSQGVGVKDSNEAEVMAILEALRIFSCSFLASLMVKVTHGMLSPR